MIITLALAGLLLSSAQTQASQDTVKILGKDVPIEFPVGGPCNDQTPHVEAAGWKWASGGTGSLGPKFRKDGGWGDLYDLYVASKSNTTRKPYHLKVVIVQNATVVSKSPIGVVRQRWASIDGEELDTVIKSLAVLKASIEGVTEGNYDVKLDVVLDDDTYADLSEVDGAIVRTGQSTSAGRAAQVGDLIVPPNPADPQREWIAKTFGPQVNDEKFETDDGIYNGPFAGVITIHPGLPLSDQVAMVGRTPMASLGYFTFSDIEAAVSLPSALFESWKRIVIVGASRGGDFSSGFRPDNDFRYPRIVSGPVWRALVEKSLRAVADESSVSQVPASSPGDLVQAHLGSLRLEGKSTKAVETDAKRPGKCYAAVEVLDYLLSSNPSVPITGVATSGSQSYVEFGVPISTFDAALAIEAGSEGEDAPSAPGTAVGDFEAAPVTTPGGAKAWEIKFKKVEPRGYVVISSGPTTLPNRTGFLQFDLKLSADENVFLDFVDRRGLVVASAILGGESAGPDEFVNSTGLADVSVPADDQWHSVVLKLDGLIGDKEIAQLRVRGGDDRISRGATSVSISAPTVVETGAQTPATTSQALEIAKLAEPLTAEQTEKVLTAVRSTNMTARLTALAVLARIKSPESVVPLTAVCRSGFAPVAAMAMKALAFQDTVDAWAVIREAVERGPFDHNRRFAAMQLEGRPDPGMGASLNFMAAKSWQARLEAVKALAAINNTSSQIIMAAMIQAEPHPSVRLQIVRSGDIKIDLVARRFIYAAVNDSSQWVRSVALSRLIDSENATVRSEALMGVRDEAAGVRLFLLDVMRVRANEAYRPALRIAVTDLVPEVRVAALKAFATQPGPVDPNEVKNTWTDPDPNVQAALKALAQAKGFKVPSP